jgi:hypothetical protein
MPKMVFVSFDVVQENFPPGTPMPEFYSISIDDPMSSPVDVPYGGDHKGEFPAVAAGHWTVSIDMKQADGTHLGTVATGTVDVPEDDVMLDAPIDVHLTVGT